MKTNIRSNRLACYTVLGQVHAARNECEHQITIDLTMVTGKGTFLEACHYEVNPKTGLGSHTFEIFGTVKRPTERVDDKIRFSAKTMQNLEAEIRVNPERIEGVVAKEMWNAFKVYPHQLDIDHVNGTITVLKNEDAVLIKPDGTVEDSNPTNDKYHFELKTLYKLINCDLIEVVNLNEELILIIDEEGKCKSDPVVNKEATALCKHHIKGWNDTIVGSAVLCPSSMLK